MPNAKKLNTSSKVESKVAKRKRKSRRKKSKPKQAAPLDPDLDKSIDDDFDSSMLNMLPAERAHLAKSMLPEQGKKRPHTPPPEIQELRGIPETIVIVTASSFRYMDQSLQSILQGVFLDLNNVLGQASAPSNPNFQLFANRPPHGRSTRRAARDASHFFQTLLPRDKVAEADELIKVEFRGTNTIRIDAPGYTETVTFGSGRWSRTRDGVTERGELGAADGARIVERTKLAGSELLRYAARSLEGVLAPDGILRATSPQQPVKG